VLQNNRQPSLGLPGLSTTALTPAARTTKFDLSFSEAGLYFAHRYAGLRRLFGSKVDWDVGDLFDFPEVLEAWRGAGKSTPNRSVSKTALQLKFLLELETQTSTGDQQTYSAQIVWRFEPNAVSSQFADDWERLSRHPFVAGRASREFTTAKALARIVDLSDVKTFVPAYDRDRGSFVPAYKSDRDLAVLWRSNLESCRTQRYLSDATATALGAAFDRFAAAVVCVKFSKLVMVEGAVVHSGR
jgi:S-DNA-T family DNA segregation ATPase FtsK/SpoIIIE